PADAPITTSACGRSTGTIQGGERDSINRGIPRPAQGETGGDPYQPGGSAVTVAARHLRLRERSEKETEMVRITQVARARKVRRHARPAFRPCASSRPSRPQRGQVHATGSASTTGKLILVVDDEIAVRMICSFNLEAAGLEVMEAVDGGRGARRRPRAASGPRTPRRDDAEAG